MQKMRKYLSLMLVIILALSLMAPTTFASQFSDVSESYQYYSAIENLAARGIINGMGDGSYAPDANVKRDEFAKIVCTGVLNSGEVAPSAGSGFTDVADDRWSSGYIKVAAAAKIINGMGDGTFAPENPVTYEQAIKMLVCALGYGEHALKRGGYPDGYLSQAQALGLIKGVVDGVQGQPANRGLIAKLVDNSLSVEIFDELTGGEGGTLEDNDSLKSVKGQIVSIYGQSIISGQESACFTDQIMLKTGSRTEKYSIENAGINNIANYLGKLVTVYYEEDEMADIYEITSLELQKGKNKITQIDDFSNINDYTDTSIEYYDSQKDDYFEAEIDDDAIIMFNGVVTGSDLSDILTAESGNSGNIVLLDTNGDGSANIVFLKIYRTILVNSITSSEYKIYNEIPGSELGSIVLDIKDRSKHISFTKNGKSASFSDIAKGNVLSIASSSNGKLVDVLICANPTKTGTIEEIGDSGRVVTMNGVNYTVAKNFLSTASSLFETDGAYILYVDVFGKIVYAKTNDTSTYQYAYLTGINKSDSIDGELTLRLYNIKSGNKLSSYTMEVADTVKVNGVTYDEDPDGVIAKLAQSASNLNQGEAATGADAYTQIIKYKTKNSQISQMVIFDPALNIPANRGDKSVLMVDNLSASTLKVNGTGTIGNYTVSSAISLVVPSDRVGGDYSGKTSAAYIAGDSYNVQIIDASVTGIPGAILVYGTTTLGAPSIDACLPSVVTSITGVVKKIGGKDKAVTKLVVVDANGNENTYYDDNSGSYTAFVGQGSTWTATFPAGDGRIRGLAVGDIVKVLADDDKLVNEIMVLADASAIIDGTQAAAIETAGKNGTSLQAQYRYFLGSARSIDITNGNDIQLTKAYAGAGDYETAITDPTYDNISGFKVFIVDTKNPDKINVTLDAQFADIVGANAANVEAANVSKLFVYQSYKTIKLIVIFK